MLEIRRIRLNEEEEQTSLWTPKRAAKAIAGADGAFQRTLKRCLKDGFETYLNVHVRPYGNGIFRVGCRGSRMRMIGFFHQGYGCFIAPHAGPKQRGKQLEARIREVRRIRDEGAWRMTDGD